MIKILLVEDDNTLGEAIKKFLTDNDYIVDWLTDYESVVFFGYDLFIIDWMLKEKSGLDLVNLLKEKGIESPIIMITVKSSINDKLKGFEAGVDDYITKPFDPKELLARIKALVNRVYKKHWIEVTDDIVLDPTDNTVFKGNEPISLTQKEFILLEILAKHKPKPLNYEFLIDYVWDSGGSYETLKSHIYSIRKKLGKDFIKSIKGIGYKIND